jgi:RimJ/RimL family protein N-acetyltransferase
VSVDSARRLAPAHRFGNGDTVAVTERLRLRRWRQTDLEPFAALNADEAVMRHLGGPMECAASDAFARYADACFEAYGFGLAVVERIEDDAFCGFVGLHRHRMHPEEVEIGWRLNRASWGQGYATEAARAWLPLAFVRARLPRLLSITTPANTASLAVMRRLGMRAGWRSRWEGLDLVVHLLDSGPAAPR